MGNESMLFVRRWNSCTVPWLVGKCRFTVEALLPVARGNQRDEPKPVGPVVPNQLGTTS
jgi:hypothetical protein